MIKKQALLILLTFLLSLHSYAAEQFETSQLPGIVVLPGGIASPSVFVAPAGLIDSSPMLENTLPGAIQNLVKYAVSFEGVAYHRGGTNPENGFDCSGFVRYVFDRAAGLSLPHSAKALSQLGSRIKGRDLLPGDLVFFHTLRNRISHVGIYLGDNQFIHASSTRTGIVMISDLKDRYWTKRFTLARRLKTPEQVGTPDASTSNLLMPLTSLSVQPE